EHRAAVLRHRAPRLRPVPRRRDADAARVGLPADGRAANADRAAKPRFEPRSGHAALACGRHRRKAAVSTEEEGQMALQLGDTAPDFEAQTTEGPIKFHDWIGDSWAVLFSHPKDFTPVCTTELGYMAKIKPEFDRRGVKVMGLSVDRASDHEQWASDIEETKGQAP